MQPQIMVTQRVNDAYVALIVDHYQVEQKCQEKEIGQHVNQQTGAETQLPIQSHQWDEGQCYTRTRVRHQQAEEEVVGRVVELAVAGDAQDDDQVGQDDGGRQRHGDGVDEALSGEQNTGVVVHRRGNLETSSHLQPAPSSFSYSRSGGKRME